MAMELDVRSFERQFINFQHVKDTIIAISIGEPTARIKTTITILRVILSHFVV